MFGTRTKLQRDALGRAIAKTPADVFAADDQVLAVIGAAADEDMDVRIVGVPVVDRDPVEPGAEVPLDIGISSRVNVLRSPSSAASSGETMKRK